MKVLVNYSNYLYKKNQKLNSITGKKIGLFDKVISYSPKDIDKKFYGENKNILTQERGGGYWLWKPYFIKKTLATLNFGDFLFYCDSGAYFINPITPLIDISLSSKQDLIIFRIDNFEKFNGLKGDECSEKIWTKKDAFILMGCDNPKYTESKQILAGYSLWKKTNFTINFIDELLNYSQDERLMTDLENQCGYANYPEYIEHRHDQSIFSLLTKKHNLNAFRDPSQFGNSSKNSYANSNYNQIIVSTRTKNLSLIARAIRKYQYLKNTLVSSFNRH